MLVKRVSKNLLDELQSVITQLSQEEFARPLDLLSGSTVGQHTRHILEFYQCFLEGNSIREIDYDLRKRNLKIETDVKFASEVIDSINENLENISDSSIILKFNNGEESQFIPSSVERELVYNVEHAIHHMAIIKIAIISAFSHVVLPANFGVAPSTVKYHMQKNVHG